MNRFLVACLGVVFTSTTVVAQEVALSTSSVGFIFAEPSGVGLRRYEMLASRLTVSHHVRPWLLAGVSAGYASARLAQWAPSAGHLSGLTDVDVFADGVAGPVRLRGTATLGVGRTGLSPDERTVAGLASYELLPMPERRWGRGNAWSVELSIPLSPGSADGELFGGVSVHGGFDALDDWGVEYRLGRITYVGARLGHDRSPWSRIELGGQVTLANVDRAGDADVFEPGSRLSAFALTTMRIARTAVLLRADAFRRTEGNAVPGEAVPIQSVAVPAREGLAGTVDTRTSLGRFALLATTQARFVRLAGTEASGSLLSATLGLEVEARGPWPGRLFLTPRGGVRLGRVAVAEGYESGMHGWEAGLAARWEAPR